MPAVAEKNIRSWLLQNVKPEEFNEKDPKKTGYLFEAIVPQGRIQDVAREFLAQGYFLECQTAVDFAECIEIVYFFNHWSEFRRSCVKIVVQKVGDVPGDGRWTAPTISNVYKSAIWFEREIFEFFGVTFAGHPGLKRLLLPESYRSYPLLKSFKGEPAGSDVEHCKTLIGEETTGFEITYPKSVSQMTQNKKDYYLNLGPQHPSTHGVLRVLLHLDGERVLDAEPIIGYSHRHHEKMMEVQQYLACWPNMGRLDYVGAMSYNFGYALLIEKAMGIAPASPRVDAIRVLTTELNRISSHLLWMGTFLLDLGAFTPFFYGFDDRENILDILEMATGERLTYDYFRFGGLDKDIPEAMIPAIRKFIPNFKKRLRDYDALVTKNIIFKQRTRNLG
ncbi:MAG TPA: NADH-quinone oxidoreductase subunit C, partial [Candidatus Omnitrophota bacterium]|nr:NADH-quinone oxidoreductase subunit C [Candidatus Omnitrophota bacterium]